MIKRGEVYWIDLEPVRGKEMKKIRPAVVVSNNTINEHAAIVIVCPITDARSKTSVIHVLVEKGEANLEKESIVHCGQIRAIDKERITDYIGKFSEDVMNKIEEGLRYAVMI